jgi:hypothetical protein
MSSDLHDVLMEILLANRSGAIGTDAALAAIALGLDKDTFPVDFDEWPNSTGQRIRYYATLVRETKT